MGIEINTKFKINDVVYVLDSNRMMIIECKIIEIRLNITSANNVEEKYWLKSESPYFYDLCDINQMFKTKKELIDSL